MQSQNTSLPLYAVEVKRQVPIPMADGTILRADVYRPRTAGRYPVLVERVAYELAGRCQYSGEYYASRGYVVVGQNVRGRFSSDGDFFRFVMTDGVISEMGMTRSYGLENNPGQAGR